MAASDCSAEIARPVPEPAHDSSTAPAGPPVSSCSDISPQGRYPIRNEYADRDVDRLKRTLYSGKHPSTRETPTMLGSSLLVAPITLGIYAVCSRWGA